MSRPVKVGGLVLAAGAGTRMGRPKALIKDADGRLWGAATAEMLRDAGCSIVGIALGAGADRVRVSLATGSWIIDVPNWDDGLSASFKWGLQAFERTTVDAVLVHLVDLPDVGAEVVKRVVTGAGSDSLARATFSGRPGHPVLIGRHHWTPLLENLHGDTGAGQYLQANRVKRVECGDLATGVDVDTQQELETWMARL